MQGLRLQAWRQALSAHGVCAASSASLSRSDLTRTPAAHSAAGREIELLNFALAASCDPLDRILDAPSRERFPPVAAGTSDEWGWAVDLGELGPAGPWPPPARPIF